MLRKNNIKASVMHLSDKLVNHSHLQHQIVFGLKGHAEFEISGESGYIQKGVGCILPSECVHTFFGDQENLILMLDITDNLSILELEAGFANNALVSLLDSPKYFQFDQGMSDLLKLLSNELEEMSSDEAVPGIIGKILLHSLHHRLSSGISLENIDGISHSRIDLSRINRFIHCNFSEKIHPSDLARLCNLSESHFYQKFRQMTGISPYQYITDERINTACAMLQETQKPIVEICFALGFSNQSAFANLFRKKTGMSPTDYRKKKTAQPSS